MFGLTQRCANEDRSNKFPTLEHSPNSIDALRYLLFVRADRKVRIKRRFVRIRNTGELSDLPGHGLLIEPLHVTLCEGIDGALDIDLEKIGDTRAQFFTTFSVRGTPAPHRHHTRPPT